jgi:hypothetical protein
MPAQACSSIDKPRCGSRQIELHPDCLFHCEHVARLQRVDAIG